MKQGLFVILAMCAFVTAMVPRDRRFVNTEEEELHRSEITTEKGITLCARRTPCAWSIYKVNKIIEMNITNVYCSCGPGTECKSHEDDTSVNALIYRCLPFGEETGEN